MNSRRCWRKKIAIQHASAKGSQEIVQLLQQFGASADWKKDAEAERKRRAMFTNSQRLRKNFLQDGIFSDKYMISFDELKLIEKAAEGSYGIVYRGEWRRQPVAAKEIRLQSDSKKDTLSKCMNEIRNEIQTLSLLRHRNIVNFMGVCIYPPATYFIVTEFIEGGNLTERLYSPNKKADFSWNQKLNIIYQISLACMFLHQQGIVHRDLKSSNILLDGYPGEHIVPKVCDFGLAKSKEIMEDEGSENTQLVGTPLWMAPEVVLGRKYDGACDVYSFGLLAPLLICLL